MDPKMSYQLLGLEPGSTEKQIRQAYLSLAKQCHPDKLQAEKTSAKQNTAGTDFVGIHRAYNQALGDARKRREVEEYIHNLIADSEDSDGSQFGQHYFEQQRKRMSEIYESWRRDFSGLTERKQKEQKKQPERCKNPQVDEPKIKKKLKKQEPRQTADPLLTESQLKSLLRQCKPIFQIIK